VSHLTSWIHKGRREQRLGAWTLKTGCGPESQPLSKLVSLCLSSLIHEMGTIIMVPTLQLFWESDESLVCTLSVSCHTQNWETHCISPLGSSSLLTSQPSRYSGFQPFIFHHLLKSYLAPWILYPCSPAFYFPESWLGIIHTNLSTCCSFPQGLSGDNASILCIQNGVTKNSGQRDVNKCAKRKRNGVLSS